jgi:hypothetical protein
MTRQFNRKIEIRFENNSIEQIDQAANSIGLSRAEFIRQATMGTVACVATPEAPAGPCKPPLTVGQYHRMVSSAYRATGGAISRSQAETCAAAALHSLYNE